MRASSTSVGRMHPHRNSPQLEQLSPTPAHAGRSAGHPSGDARGQENGRGYGGNRGGASSTRRPPAVPSMFVRISVRLVTRTRSRSTGVERLDAGWHTRRMLGPRWLAKSLAPAHETAAMAASRWVRSLFPNSHSSHSRSTDLLPAASSSCPAAVGDRGERPA
jgi:hypothetical protein